jgi:hypothetical protein
MATQESCLESGLEGFPVPFLREEELIMIYREFRDYIKHENVLINYRLQWSLSIQAFLFAAYGLGLQHYGDLHPEHIVRFSKLVPAVGIAVSIIALLSVLAAELAIRKIREQWKGVADRPEYKQTVEVVPGLTGGGSDWAYCLGHAWPIGIPFLLGIAWGAIWVFV